MQLVIASPWVDSKGPLTAYRALVDALQKASIYEEVPMRRVFLRSPNDPLVKTLERGVKEHNEGFLHILRHNRKEYSAVFRGLRPDSRSRRCGSFAAALKS
jgi:hypothetical protein